MLNIKISQTKTDILGAGASVLCLIHCLATPYLFVLGAGLAPRHAEGPVWWGLVDFSLLVVSLFAVYWSARKTSKVWMKYALYIAWALLALIILNEKIEGLGLPEEAIYVPSIVLAMLHLYNRKYCQCEDETCCAVSGN